MLNDEKKNKASHTSYLWKVETQTCQIIVLNRSYIKNASFCVCFCVDNRLVNFVSWYYVEVCYKGLFSLRKCFAYAILVNNNLQT